MKQNSYHLVEHSRSDYELFLMNESGKEYSASRGFAFWIFNAENCNLASAVMAKLDQEQGMRYDLFYWPQLDVCQPLQAGARNVLQFRVTHYGLIYQTENGWFGMNDHPFYQRGEDGREVLIGDYFLGEKEIADKLYSFYDDERKLNISAWSSMLDTFDCDVYTDVIIGEKDEKNRIHNAAARLENGKYNIFQEGEVIDCFPLYKLRAGSRVYLFKKLKYWDYELVYKGDDAAPWELFYDGEIVIPMSSVANGEEGTVLMFTPDRMERLTGKVYLLNDGLIAVDNQIINLEYSR